jgi:hypothetical protein
VFNSSAINNIESYIYSSRDTILTINMGAVCIGFFIGALPRVWIWKYIG